MSISRAPRFPLLVLLFALLLAILGLVLPAPVFAGGAGGAADAVTKDEARARLRTLDKFLRKSGSTDDELLAALEEVAGPYKDHGKDAKARDAYRDKADKLFLRAISLAKPGRDDIVARAAVFLEQLGAHRDARGRSKLSRQVQATITSRILKRRKLSEISRVQLDAAFGVLGGLNQPSALLWLSDDYLTTEWLEVPLVIAALKSMARFHDTPGRIRHEVVRTMLKTYASVEAVARKSSNVPADISKKRFWDEIRLFAIPVMQKLTGAPKNEKGEALSTMREFKAWFSHHKSLRDSVWAGSQK